MATRLATARNFITVTSVASSDDSEINSSNSSSTTTNTASDVQRTTQLTPVSLHHVNLSQKKIILQTAPSGSVSVIDVVPLESSDSSDSQILVAESNGLNQNSQQVTAQVAVVQAQGSPNGQHFIAVSGKLFSTPDGSYVQYVDSDLYSTTTGQESSQMSYPVYAVGSSGIDYTSGQQYYAFLDAVLNLEFNTIESLWREFWRAHDNNNMDECEEEKYLSKQKLFKLCQIEAVQKFLQQIDFQFYQNMVDVLIPDVLRPIPSTLTQSIRNFAKNLENWLTSAMIGCPEEVIQIKLTAVSAFSQTLRRYTSLNHLAQAARAVLHNTTQISQMLSDLNRVDFHNVQEQASWVCQCDPAIVQRLESEFKSALQQQNTLEQWAAWLRLVVDQALEEHRGKPSYVKAARQFLLKWSFYSSMVIRDLTLRSAASFGSFHLIRLLYDEYMFFILERKVAENTNTQPIAVMNARMSDENFTIRPNICYSDFDVKVEPSKALRH